MKRLATYTLTGAGALALVLAGTLTAQALWSSSMTVEVPTVSVGSVAFSASPFGAAAEEAQVSANGEAVSVSFPGAQLVELTERTIDEPGPMIWRFVARGGALGIAGMDYSVAVTAQQGASETHDLSSGIAKPGTLLEGSTLKVYRAALGGDCSAVPATPQSAEGETPRNVYVFGGDDVVLQEPGTAVEGQQSEQEWCVAATWNSPPDERYRNDATVTAIAVDGGVNGAIDSWHALIGFPPALALLGTYASEAAAEALAMDGTRARGVNRWGAEIYPDPSGEPDVVITLTPTVTSSRSAVASGN